MKFFEDMPLGLKNTSTETYTFEAEEIMSFAGKWDPMPFHIDEELAAQSPLGKLFASSLHTIAAAVRLTHSVKDGDIAAVAGLGWQDCRFPLPVCAGDTIRVTSEVVEHRESKSKPDRGIITALNSVYNQDDQLVAEFKIATMVLKRPQE